MKGIDNILKPLYDLWHKVMDKLSVKNDVLLIDGKEVIVKMIVENIKALTDSQCDSLQCGDVVAKKTGNMFHLYQVTYKEDKHGICLTYQAAGLQETQSYDYTNEHWVYNSEDLVHTGGHTDAEVKALAVDAVEEATSGTIQDSLGLDSNGNLVKGQASGGGGIKLYRHLLACSGDFNYLVTSKSNTVITSWSDVLNNDSVIKIQYNGKGSSMYVDGTCLISRTAGQIYLSSNSYNSTLGGNYVGWRTAPSITSDTVTEVQ